MAKIAMKILTGVLERKRRQVISEIHSVVAIYETYSQAEDAVKELHRFGFDMKKMSIVGRDCHTDEHVAAYYNPGDRMKYWGGPGLYSLGIPKNSVLKYESALKSDKFLVLAYGNAGEVSDAGDILQTTRPIGVAIYSAEREQRAGAAGE